ncbi:proteoglycan 4-like protein [Lates japonicus]|uniref:Proteoglycan 4-like protein n=1 Tax=Lates japonicus TaxID=270547 RepID=A0AAD3MPN6_LATJO|nr:proteoglycan 4-like protein [Lates japonicus]
MDTKKDNKHIFRVRDKDGKIVQEITVDSLNEEKEILDRLMEVAERQKTLSTRRAACKPHKRAPPVNPWNIPAVADQRARLSLDEDNFPSLQRQTIREQTKDG